MKKYLLVLFLFTGFRLFCQNVGINNPSPEATLDIYGDLILRSADLIAADGNNPSVNVSYNAFSNYRISGPMANFTISGLSASPDGKLVTLFNDSGFDMTLSHEDISAAAIERILIENMLSLSIPNLGSVTLQYVGTKQRWVIKNHSQSSSSLANNTWKVSGNSGLNSSNYLGTNDNFPLILKSNGKTVAHLEYGYPSNNYIGTNFQRTGIGILESGAPTHTLEVGLADIVGGSQGVLGIRGTNYMSHFNYGVDEHTYIRAGKPGGNIFLNDIAGLGNVGIGTNYPPTRKLEIYKGRILFTGAENINNGTYPGIEFTNGAGTAHRGYIGMGSDDIIGFYSYPTFAFGLMMDVNTGYIGIGTDTPSHKLSVNGSIRSKEVIVETANWPDYVFKKSYSLPSLQEVEKYIDTHHHLPNVPSAIELESNGLPLGELQKLLMQKIEELTLYIIQQNKLITNLQEEVNTLKLK